MKIDTTAENNIIYKRLLENIEHVNNCQDQLKQKWLIIAKDLGKLRENNPSNCDFSAELNRHGVVINKDNRAAYLWMYSADKDKLSDLIKKHDGSSPRWFVNKVKPLFTTVPTKSSSPYSDNITVPTKPSSPCSDNITVPTKPSSPCSDNITVPTTKESPMSILKTVPLDTIDGVAFIKEHIKSQPDHNPRNTNTVYAKSLCSKLLNESPEHANVLVSAVVKHIKNGSILMIKNLCSGSRIPHHWITDWCPRFANKSMEMIKIDDSFVNDADLLIKIKSLAALETYMSGLEPKDRSQYTADQWWRSKILNQKPLGPVVANLKDGEKPIYICGKQVWPSFDSQAQYKDMVIAVLLCFGYHKMYSLGQRNNPNFNTLGSEINHNISVYLRAAYPALAARLSSIASAMKSNDSMKSFDDEWYNGPQDLELRTIIGEQRIG